jgi:outer membrane biosynthesis protein TonB
MKASEMLKKINTLLGLRVNLEELILDNGTRIFADSYDKGESVFIVTDEDERVPLPAGEYMIEVKLETDPEAEEEGYKDGIKDEKEDEKEDLEEEVIVEVPEEVAPELSEIIAAVVEVVAPIIEEVKAEVEELKKKYGEVDKVKEKMSKQPARKPLAHAPTNKQNDTFLYGQNREQTTLDRVLSKISQIKK